SLRKRREGAFGVAGTSPATTPASALADCRQINQSSFEELGEESDDSGLSLWLTPSWRAPMRLGKSARHIQCERRKAASRHESACSACAFFGLAQPQAGDASVVRMRYYFSNRRGSPTWKYWWSMITR